MGSKKHRQRARPDAVGIVFPEEIAIAVHVHEEVGIDDPATHLRLAAIIAKTRSVDWLSGDQGRAVVDPRTTGRWRAREAYRQGVGRLPGGEHRPIFFAR